MTIIAIVIVIVIMIMIVIVVIVIVISYGGVLRHRGPDRQDLRRLGGRPEGPGPIIIVIIIMIISN